MYISWWTWMQSVYGSSFLNHQKKKCKARIIYEEFKEMLVSVLARALAGGNYTACPRTLFCSFYLHAFPINVSENHWRPTHSVQFSCRFPSLIFLDKSVPLSDCSQPEGSAKPWDLLASKAGFRQQLWISLSLYQLLFCLKRRHNIIIKINRVKMELFWVSNTQWCIRSAKLCAHHRTWNIGCSLQDVTCAHSHRARWF